MKAKGGLKFTGILIILGVIAYLALIVNTTRLAQSPSVNSSLDNEGTQVLDTTTENPFSNIYQKASIENKNKKEKLLNNQ